MFELLTDDELNQLRATLKRAVAHSWRAHWDVFWSPKLEASRKSRVPVILDTERLIAEINGLRAWRAWE